MSDPGVVREIVRTARIEFPVPYICVVLVVLAMGGMGLASFQSTPLSWFSEGLGLLSGIAAIALPLYAAVRKPELLRSERHIMVSQAFTVLLDKDITQEARTQIGKIVDGVLLADAEEHKIARKQLPNPTFSVTEDGDA